MLRRTTLFGLALIGAAPLMAQMAPAQEVNLYSARHYDTDLRIYETFTRETGIRVNLIEGDGEQLLQRILSEGDNSPADLYVTVDGVKSSQGKIRVQAYRGVEQDWLEKGRWLSRIEVPAKAGTMTFCVPLPAAGTFGIAVRHDANGNGKTDLSQDGGGMSNNPSLNIFNLGKPNYRKTAFTVSGGVQSIRIRMRYM